MTTKASGALPPSNPLHAPGLKRRKRAGRDALYWMPLDGDIKRGFDPKSVTLSSGMTEEEVAAACRRYQENLRLWRAGIEGPIKYSFSWLIGRYTKDKFSPFQRISFKSQKNYTQCLRTIERDIGKVILEPDGPGPSITAEDIWHWHEKWSSLDDKGIPTTPSKARHLVTQVRMLVKYGVSIGLPGAHDLHVMLTAIEFPTTAPRSSAPTFGQVAALVSASLSMGYRSMAISSIAQFEFTERRISIIGSWRGDQWRPGWLWQNISKDWVIKYTQNKRGVVIREFDLKCTPLLLELIQETPDDKRVGPVIICEKTNRPWREKHYTDTFREVARAAGLPDEIWSMDLRAGGATEADSLPGITDRDIKAAGGWQSDVFNRYTRAPQRRAQGVVTMRQRARIPNG